MDLAMFTLELAVKSSGELSCLNKYNCKPPGLIIKYINVHR